MANPNQSKNQTPPPSPDAEVQAAAKAAADAQAKAEKAAAPTPSAPTSGPDAGWAPPVLSAEEKALREKVYAAEDKLQRLQQEKRLEILNAEIAKLENGGKSEQQLHRERIARAKMEKTHKEDLEHNGKVFKVAKYKIPSKSFKPDLPAGIRPGDIPKLRPEGYIVTVLADQLPGDEWLPVEKAPAGPAVQFNQVG
jgi:hypothetical protein